jgi:GH43 family beta-xylosidase
MNSIRGATRHALATTLASSSATTVASLSATTLASLAIALASFALASCGGGGGSGGTSGTPTAAPAAQQASAQAAGGFTNPLLASGADPFVTTHAGRYYYLQTLGDRIALAVTPAMSRLGTARWQTIFSAPAGGANSRDVWAPELHRVDDAWYVYYTAGDGTATPDDPHASQRMFVLENRSDDPLSGTWRDAGRLVDPSGDFWSIDATVFTHGGRRYVAWSGRAFDGAKDQDIYVARLADPVTLAGPRVRISVPDQPWERAGDRGVNEAPQALAGPDGTLFLFYSANGCWTDHYALGMLTLRTGGDPLEPSDWAKRPAPVLAGDAAGGVWAPGHNGFFKSPDGTEDWIVYHANPASGAGCGERRNPRMQRVQWRDGLPVIDPIATPGAALTLPAGEMPPT